MSFPQNVGLPSECKLNSLDYSLPANARSSSIKVQPSNLSSLTASVTTSAVANVLSGDLPFPVQNIIFDLPCSGSPSQFLDTRLTTLHFRATYGCSTAGGATSLAAGNASNLRGGAYSFFDRMFITAQNGNIVEDINEYGVTYDTLVNLQMNNATRDSVATMYGFTSDNGITSQGHNIAGWSGTTSLANTESHAYSIPLMSALIGVNAQKFLNIGRTGKLQLTLQTSNILPVSILNGAGAVANVLTVVLDNFSIQMETLDIGMEALAMLDESLVDGKNYLHGVTYKSSSSSVAASSGSTTLLCGLRGSSIKSLFVRFQQNGAVGTAGAGGNYNGKYDSFNPMLTGINFQIAGIRYPQVPIDVLHYPSQSMRELQVAMGSFNSTQYQSSIPLAQYCKLSLGGTASVVTTGTAQENSWSVVNAAPIQSVQSQYIFGVNTEIIPKRGVMSGLNCTSAPIFLELSIGTAPTNTHNAIVIGMFDTIFIHDVVSGTIDVRL